MKATKATRQGAGGREAILDAARQIFARRGYAGASMRQIAETAGVTKAAIYYHFADKASLFREVLSHALEQIHRRKEAALLGIVDPLERLRALVWAHLQQFAEQRDLVRQIYVMIFLPEEASVPVTDIFHDQSCIFREVLTDCTHEGYLEPEEVEEAALVVLGALEYAGAMSLLDKDAPPPSREYAEAILTRVLPWASQAPSKQVRPGRRTGRIASLLMPLLMPVLTAAGLGMGSGLLPAAAQTAPLDVIPGSSGPIPIEVCVEEALEQNSSILAARQGRRELSGQKKQAVSLGLPSLDASGTWSRGRDPSFAFDQTFGGGGDGAADSTASGLDSLFAGFSFIPAPEDIQAQTFWRTSLNARWEVQPSLIYNAVGAAQLGIRRQEALIADTEHRAIEEVMRAYHQTVMVGEQIAALDADIEAKREFLEITRRRLELGFSTPLDTLRAAVAYGNLLPQRRNLAQRLRDAGANLNVLMGRPPHTALSLSPQEQLELEPIGPELAIEALPHRPDLMSLELMIEILAKNRGRIKAEHRPVVSADASYGYVTGDFGDMFDQGHDFWNASVTLRVPLFDGLRTKGRVQEAEAQIRRTELDQLDAVRRARLEVHSLLGELEAARENYRAARLNAEAAEDALEQIQMRYELGQSDYLSVLDVQADRSQARSNLISARNEVLSVTASLKRALGFRPDRSLANIKQQLNREAS